MFNYLLETFTQFSKKTENKVEGEGTNDTENAKTCLSCRIISAVGLGGGGAYIAYEATKRKSPIQKYVMLGVASGFLGLGVARAFNLPPFPYTAKIT